jgi:hypothetical protein
VTNGEIFPAYWEAGFWEFYSVPENIGIYPTPQASALEVLPYLNVTTTINSYRRRNKYMYDLQYAGTIPRRSRDKCTSHMGCKAKRV